jgi:hypothetical protein
MMPAALDRINKINRILSLPIGLILMNEMFSVIEVIEEQALWSLIL